MYRDPEHWLPKADPRLKSDRPAIYADATSCNKKSTYIPNQCALIRNPVEDGENLD